MLTICVYMVIAFLGTKMDRQHTSIFHVGALLFAFEK